MDAVPAEHVTTGRGRGVIGRLQAQRTRLIGGYTRHRLRLAERAQGITNTKEACQKARGKTKGQNCNKCSHSSKTTVNLGYIEALITEPFIRYIGNSIQVTIFQLNATSGPKMCPIYPKFDISVSVISEIYCTRNNKLPNSSKTPTSAFFTISAVTKSSSGDGASGQSIDVRPNQ